MTARTNAYPQLRQLDAKRLQRRVPLLVSLRAWPDPLNTQRRFPPSLRRSALVIADRHARARAGHVRQRFRAELQRHTRLQGQEVERRPDRVYVRCLARSEE